MIFAEEYTFQFASGGTHDASVSEISTPLPFCNNFGWSLIPFFDSLDGSPLYSIEVSNDGIIWDEYQADTKDADIDQGFTKKNLLFDLVRINYKAQDNTTGTVSFTIKLKK